MFRLLVFLFLVLYSTQASAAPKTYGPYTAFVTSVYDGDTIKADIEIFPGLIFKRSIRINGIDTPERRGKCPLEKQLAWGARQIVEDLITGGEGEYLPTRVTISNVFEGKYAGRVIADVHTREGVNIAERLIELDVARLYDGTGARLGWCD